MDLPSQTLLQNLAEGDPTAERAVYDRFAVRLIALARRMLADKLAARLDPEDVVQSAYRSFFVHARDGAYEVRQSGDLWRLLAAITRHKLLHQAARQTAEKRSPARESDGGEIADEEASPAAVAAITDEVAAIMRELSREERQLLELRLRDEPLETIAAALGKSPRTIRRMLLELRRVLERRLAGEVSRVIATRGAAAKLAVAADLAYRDFELQQMVGAGAFGKVYRAWWKSRAMTVAVKSLRKRFLLDERAIEHFLREARIIAALDHPGIIRAHGIGRTPAGGYFLVLDWHAGGDLGSHVGFTARDCADFVAQAAEAIAHAHERGVVHCDLKPTNLLVAGDGRIVVTDFGFAHALRSVEDASIGGTLGFSAPELWHGGSPTPACDVYSLGRVLRDLLKRAAPAEPLEFLAAPCENSDPAQRGDAISLAQQLRRLLA